MAGVGVLDRRTKVRLQSQSQKNQVVTNESMGQLLGAEPADDADYQRKGGSRIEHVTSRRYKLYRPTAAGYYIPVMIPEDNVVACMDGGYLEACPDCGTADCGENINSCAGRDPVPFGRCPVAGCNEGRGKRIYDNPLMSKRGNDGEPGEVALDYAATTPAERIKGLIDRHIVQCHPAEASMYLITAVAPATEADAFYDKPELRQRQPVARQAMTVNPEIVCDHCGRADFKMRAHLANHVRRDHIGYAN